MSEKKTELPWQVTGPVNDQHAHIPVLQARIGYEGIKEAIKFLGFCRYDDVAPVIANLREFIGEK